MRLLLIGFVAASTVATAAPITVEFSGRITDISSFSSGPPDAPFELGAEISGAITYDPDLLIALDSGNAATLYLRDNFGEVGNWFTSSLQIAGRAFSVEELPYHGGTLSIIDDHASDTGLYDSFHVYDASREFIDPNVTEQFRLMRLSLGWSSNLVPPRLTNNLNPYTPIDFSQASYSSGFFMDTISRRNEDSSSYSAFSGWIARFSIDNVSQRVAVPEPDIRWMLLGGLAILFLSARTAPRSAAPCPRGRR